MKAGEIDDFEYLLGAAESQAETDWEMHFVSDMQEKYEQYGDNCFVSEKHLETLEIIAGEE
jgi:hypothetical protein